MSDLWLWGGIGSYGLAMLGHLLSALFSFRRLGRVAFFLLLTGFVLHTVYFFPTIIAQDYPYLLHQSDALQLISWLSVVGFLGLHFRFRWQGAGVFFSPLAFIFLFLAACYGGRFQLASPMMASPWAVIHLFLVFMAFTIFLVSIMVGLIFVLLELQVKHKKISPFFQRLPSLESLDRIHYRALTMGFVLLTLGIVAGGLLSKDIRGVYFTGDPKQVWVVGMWCFYAVLLNTRIRAGWRGRRGILLSLIGFIAFVILLIGFLGMSAAF